MKAYLLSLIGTALVITVAESFSPAATAKQVRFLASLLFLWVLISPLPKAITSLSRIMESGLPQFSLQPSEEEAQQLQNALDAATGTYFAQTLTELLEREFSISEGEVRCRVSWREEDGKQLPDRVTVILSGSAIWIDPAPIEKRVEALLGCQCVTAIEP